MAEVSYFEKVKSLTDLDASDELLKALVFEMSRYFDSNFTKEIKKLQKTHDVVLDTPTRKLLRKKYYYGSFCPFGTSYDIPTCVYNDDDVEEAFKDFHHRLKTYDPNKIISSLQKRVDDLRNNYASDAHMREWLKQYDERRADKLYSFAAIKLNQKLFAAAHYDENILTDFIAKTYEGLENYRHLAIIVEGEI